MTISPTEGVIMTLYRLHFMNNLTGAKFVVDFWAADIDFASGWAIDQAEKNPGWLFIEAGRISTSGENAIVVPGRRGGQ